MTKRCPFCAEEIQAAAITAALQAELAAPRLEFFQLLLGATEVSQQRGHIGGRGHGLDHNRHRVSRRRLLQRAAECTEHAAHLRRFELEHDEPLRRGLVVAEQFAEEPMVFVESHERMDR
jgi:hypothetical protein